MKLTGNVTIDLTDVDTGEVTSVSEENMVTEAVNNVLGLNPLGVFYKLANVYDEIDWTSSLLPICPNLIGGILLFPNALEERTDNILQFFG